jgi:eukaryotic-like serine/threonine-protein kinase
MSDACPSCGSLRTEGLCPVCLITRALPSSPLGEELELGELIGSGGMGSVFRARDLRRSRDVAVKLLAAQSDADAQARLEREARTLALLDHPNIVRVFQISQSEGQPFIAMELLEGGSLADHLPLPAARVARLGIELCAALAYAHARGVVHRDLKPQNVLFAADGRAVLTDFGIARSFGDALGSWTLTAEGSVAGTPEYMAPEARKGAQPDPRMDMYSLGVVLYEALSGELPQGNFPPLPAGWDRAIRRALAPDPGQRYADAAAFARALSALAQAEMADAPLASDEQSFMRAVAGMQTTSTALWLWALYLSITPRVIAREDLQPLLMLVTRTLPDGRMLSVARLEIWPMLVALLGGGFAVGCYALLRRHWRQEGLERELPDKPVPGSLLVLRLGIFNVLGFVARLWMQAHGFGYAIAFVPVLGGISEAVTVYAAWMTCLELWRRQRPLHRELRLWAGLFLSALPPVIELLRYLASFEP